MSALIQIQDQLMNTGARIAEAERLLAIRQSRAVRSSLKSLYKLRGKLESEFYEVARRSQVDVLTYRLFEGGERPSMSLLGRALDSFQSLYAILYASVSSNQPRDTAKLSSEMLRDSAFEFSHSYAGSAGFVFTIPNERLLLGETKLDQAMSHLLLMAKSSSTEEIKGFSRKFGLASVRAIYNWANALSASSAGADIQWRKNDDVKGSALLQPAEVQALRDLIDLTSDVEVDENIYVGFLLGYDSKSRVFRFDPADGGAVIKGTISDDADLPPKVEMAARSVGRSIVERYSATIKTTSRVHYATDKPDISHKLLRLAAVKTQ